MIPDSEKLREYRQDGITCRLDDEKKLARLAKIKTGCRRKFRIPDHVMVDGVRYDIDGIAHLEVLDLPSTLKDFGFQNIVGCKNLHVLTIRSPQMIEIRQSELEDVPTETCHLFVPENLLESYRNDEVWGWFKHIHAIHDKPELMFHCGGTKMFIDKKTGELQPDDEDHTLEELIAFYEDNCEAYYNFLKKLKEAEAPYRKTEVENGKEVTYIDYDSWEKEDPDTCWNYGLAEFNGSNALEMQEWDIDLKIAHINKEKGIDIAEAEDFRKMMEHVNKREAKE